MHNHDDDPLHAAEQIGIALQPTQDWVAHADYGIYDEGGIYDKHNMFSPQTNLLYYEPEVWKYPDLPSFAAINGPDGCAAGSQCIQLL